MKRTIGRAALVIVSILLSVVGLVQLWPQTPLSSALTAPDAPATRLVCYGCVDSPQGPLLVQPTRAGRIMQVFVKEGQTVSKDTTLLQLDDRQVKLYEEEAQLAVRASEAQCAKAEAGRKQYQAKRGQANAALQLAQSKLRWQEHLLITCEEALKNGLSNQGQLDLARDQVNLAKELVTLERYKLAELDAADPKIEVDLAQLQLERSHAQLRRAIQEREEMLLKAPVAGMVLRVYAQEGDLAGPTAPRPAAVLAPVGEWIVRCEVPQEFASRVRKGSAVQVEDGASGAVLSRGTIAYVADCFLPRRQLSLEPTAVNTGLALECVITLEERHASLRLGQRVRVRILEESPQPGESGRHTKESGTR